MGFAHGSVSLSRFRVIGLAPQPKLAQLNQQFIPHQAKRLKLQGANSELSFGWSRASEWDDAEHWDLSDCLISDGLCFQLRIDRRRVSAKLLQSLAKQRLAKLQAKRSKAVNRVERKQLWQDTKDELIGLCLPEIQNTECFWNLETHEIFLASTAKRQLAIFEELFVKSFCQPLACHLIKVEVPLLGQKDTDLSTLQALNILVPTQLTSH
jgi:hypothetical protein